jgi:hypothetical protein
MSAQIVLLALFALGAIIAYPKAVFHFVLVWLVIALLLLRYVAVFAPVRGSTPHEFASGSVHATLTGLRESDGLSTG